MAAGRTEPYCPLWLGKINSQKCLTLPFCCCSPKTEFLAFSSLLLCPYLYFFFLFSFFFFSFPNKMLSWIACSLPVGYQFSFLMCQPSPPTPSAFICFSHKHSSVLWGVVFCWVTEPVFFYTLQQIPKHALKVQWHVRKKTSSSTKHLERI